jgi:hypothetical protein
MGLSEPLLWYRSRFFGVNFMRYIGIGYNQQYGISLCLKTMIYLRHVKRKGFYSGIMSPLDILYSRKYHGIDEWGLKNQDKPWWTCPGLNMAKRQAWNCISKDFLFYITFFFVIFSWSDLLSGMGGARDEAVSWSLVFPPNVNQFGIVLNFDLDWWNSLLESIVEWFFGVPNFGCHSECFTMKTKTTFPRTSLAFEQSQNCAKIAYRLRYSNIYNSIYYGLRYSNIYNGI